MRTLCFTRQKTRDPALVLEEVHLLVDLTGRPSEWLSVEMDESGGKKGINQVHGPHRCREGPDVGHKASPWTCPLRGWQRPHV